ncbi:MAG: DUF456 family protein [Thermus sp.]|uniref:DUF456 domain-containing protein n=1 Tax=unclassified Thermus TaxID=2619321 RepID=UPI0002389D7B|nr:MULTISPECIES: DUF456 family protein [unclassified Thermus]AEV15459.1 hypothetical protein TCCBUS3UF1_4110 [Thermus sp. CCB_US3_UF1]MCS6868244.1 DUF456 family protein [Thermus sp.]MCS7218655.1 DUF456 family protein [Thermus sp.]MCX7848599.1 DUF456 family protein [Thermus sp.]MDW8017918.1 DUF456 family protein [Thermus sp.]
MEALADWLFVAFWVAGVGLTLLPFVPATLIILLGAFLHELLLGFRELSVGAWLALGVLALLAMTLDNVAALLGARRYGAGRAGLWGAFLGGVLGLFLGVVGVLVLPFLLAWLLEYLSGRRPDEALRAAWGTLVGLLGGVVAKTLVHVAMGLLVLRAIF